MHWKISNFSFVMYQLYFVKKVEKLTVNNLLFISCLRKAKSLPTMSCFDSVFCKHYFERIFWPVVFIGICIGLFCGFISESISIMHFNSTYVPAPGCTCMTLPDPPLIQPAKSNPYYAVTYLYRYQNFTSTENIECEDNIVECLKTASAECDTQTFTFGLYGENHDIFRRTNRANEALAVVIVFGILFVVSVVLFAICFYWGRQSHNYEKRMMREQDERDLEAQRLQNERIMEEQRVQEERARTDAKNPPAEEHVDPPSMNECVQQHQQQQQSYQQTTLLAQEEGENI